MKDLLEIQQAIASCVFPDDYVNPNAASEYDLVVIGAGTAGLIAALGAKALGASVALIENRHMGGDCLNTGCVPSKALIEISKKYYAAQTLLKKYGVQTDLDVSNWIQYTQHARAKIAPHDAVSRFVAKGIDVFLGQAFFTSSHQIELQNSQKINFRKCAICTGASPKQITIEGLDQQDVMTNETLFELHFLPKHLLILGTGPIGCELAQAFARLGTKVTMVTKAKQVFTQNEAEIQSRMRISMEQLNIDILWEAEIEKCYQENGAKKAWVTSQQNSQPVLYDKVLMAIGRKPNTENLMLDKAGIKTNKHGFVEVNSYLQTSQKHVFASGDVIGKEMFTHLADAQSRVLVQNACTFFRKKASLSVPWVIYTQPEVATYLAEGVDFSKLTKIKMNFDQVDRSKIKADGDHFVFVYTDPKERIQGAEILHPIAGELLPQIQLAVKNKMKLSDFSALMYAYPTESEIFKKMGDQARAKNFTPLLQKMSKWMVKWR